MNIFYLNKNPELAVKSMIDVHIHKMCSETGQMLSTAHRVLDGTPHRVKYTLWKKRKTRTKTIYVLDDVEMNNNLYKAAYVNHPCNVWVRQSVGNYFWLYRHFVALLEEYRLRFGQDIACIRLLDYLCNLPHNFKRLSHTKPALCMPDIYKESDPVIAYNRYYVAEKLQLDKITRV